MELRPIMEIGLVSFNATRRHQKHVYGNASGAFDIEAYINNYVNTVLLGVHPNA
jgi:hypothetical protein